MTRRRSRLLALAAAIALSGFASGAASAAANPSAAPAPPGVPAPAAPRLAAPTLAAPVEPFLALRLFDRPATPWGPGHRGIDVAAGVGQEVRAPADGVVTFAGEVVDRGVVTVRVAGGLLSTVEPVDASVGAGDRVRAGQPLGVVGGEPGHCRPRVCVHWGVRDGGRYVNPLDVLRGFGPVRLLPLDGAGSD